MGHLYKLKVLEKTLVYNNQMESKLRIAKLKALNKILLKPIHKYFLRLSFISKYFKKPIKIEMTQKNDSKLVINTDRTFLKTSEKLDKYLSRSPIETCERLYSNAKEIKRKKEILKETYKEKYSFSPIVTGFTGRWLQIKKNEKKSDNKQENLAVVSAQNTKTNNLSITLRSFTPIL